MFKNTILYIVLIVTAVSCARPFADYSYDLSSDVLPSKVTTNNLSTDAESYSWSLDGVEISTEESPELIIKQSGRHQLTLIATKNNKSTKKTKEIILKAPQKCLASIETSKGEMIVELFDETPKHRDNFVKLANEGFYSGTIFHRVIKGFMIQGGDPLSKDPDNGKIGTGGPGYTVEAEFVPGLYHYKGYLAAARQGDAVNPEKRSSGSQFYIVEGKDVSASDLQNMQFRTGIEYSEKEVLEYENAGGTPFLDGQYTVFGRVIKGIDIVDAIAASPTNQMDRPLDPIVIEKVTVLR